MNPFSLSTAWLRRDFRAGELTLLLAALIIAVAAISSVGFFVDRIRLALNLQARQLLGADLVIASDAPLPETVLKQAQTGGLRSAQTVSFPSMALADASPSQAAPAAVLTSVKAVSPGYPLRGTLRTRTELDGPDAPADSIPQDGTVWVDPSLLQALGVSIGDSLHLGERRFQITRVIALEPDRGANFVNFAPRAMMALSDLASTGLVQPASRVTHRTLLSGDSNQLSAFENWAAQGLSRGQRMESLDNGRPELRATLDRAQQFLALVSLLAALIAAVAIAVAARRFAQRHLDGCAVMRAIGITQTRLFSALLLQMLWLGLAGGLIGSAIGWLGHLMLVKLAGPALKFSLPAASMLPGIQATVAGLLLLLGFAAVPLARLAGVPPLRVLRRDLGAPPVSAWIAALLALGAFSVLLLWLSGDRKLAGMAILGFAAAAVIFVGVSWLAIRLLSPLRHLVGQGSHNAALRVALASWSRRQGASIAQTAALSVGLMALMLLTVTRGDLLDSWQRAAPPDAPNRFLINIQPDQREAVSDMLTSLGIRQAELLPMVRGRLVEINGKPVDLSQFDSDRARRLFDREFNLSYLSTIQPHNRTVTGRWLDPAEPEASIEIGIMQTLGLSLGDRLTFDIAGEPVEVTTVGARKVAWDSMQVNFFLIMSPRALGDRPQTWITSFYLPPSRLAATNELLARFPNLTVFDTSSIVQQVQSILEHVVRAVQFLFLFTLAAGVMVLYAALASSRDDRVREAGLMRALGASRAQLHRAQLFELAITGALAGLLAALGAMAIGAVLAHQVFQFEFTPRWSTLPIAILVGTALSVIAGWFSLRSVVESPPLATLRGA